MLKFVDAITGNPETTFFRVLDSEFDHPSDWGLEPLHTGILSSEESCGLHIMKARNVLPDGTIRDCYMDINFPERGSDYVFFIEHDSFHYGYHHEFPGEILPAAALDCFGIYELFYSRKRPQVGIDILRRGLPVAKRKHFIAQDLGYILRDERRFREAIPMFKLAAEGGIAPSFMYGEIAGAYAELGDIENEKKYMALSTQSVASEIAESSPSPDLEKIVSPIIPPRSRALRWFLSLFQKSRKDEPTWPVMDAHKGKSLSLILEECGKPYKNLAGYHNLAGEQTPQDLSKGVPPEPHMTLVYRRPNGTLFVWLHQACDSWRCFKSFWLPEGWIPDEVLAKACRESDLGSHD